MLSAKYAGCVYVAINLKNGSRYIGKTRMPLSKRLRCHKSAALRGGRTTICHAIRKYGMDGFRWEVLYVSSDEAALFAAERELIAAAKSSGVRLYNRTDGGDGASGLFWSKEMRAKLSAATKGRIHSPEAVAKMSAAHKGRAKSQSHRNAIAKSRASIVMPPWTEERRAKHRATWERKVAEGFTHTEETRLKMSNAAKARVR